MGRRATAGAEVEIKEGLTKDLDGNYLDVSGLVGVVEDEEGYVNEKTGDHMVGVRAMDECGDGLAFVPEKRLVSPGRRSFGLSQRGRANYDKVFKKKSRRRS